VRPKSEQKSSVKKRRGQLSEGRLALKRRWRRVAEHVRDWKLTLKFASKMRVAARAERRNESFDFKCRA
jgi:hypothetical protein